MTNNILYMTGNTANLAGEGGGGRRIKMTNSILYMTGNSANMAYHHFV